MAVGRVVAALLQALILALTARSVLPEAFGLLSALLGLATFAQTAFDLGIGTYILRERARDPASPGVRAGLRVNQVTSGLLAIISAGAIVLVAVVIDPLFWLMLPLSIWASAERNADTRVGISVADGRAYISVLNLVLRRTIALALFVGLSHLGVSGVLAFSLAVSIAALISAVGANVYVKRHVPAQAASMASVIREARPYWLNSAATQARNLDATIVGVTGGAAAAGLYAAASRLTVPLQILPSSMAAVVIPASVKAVRDGQSLRPILRSLLATVGATVVLAALLIVVLPPLIPLVLGENYRGSTVVIQIVVAFLPLTAVASVMSALLQGLGDGRFVAAIAAAATAICLVAVFAGTILAGPAGAAIAVGLTSLLQAILLVVRAWGVVRRFR